MRVADISNHQAIFDYNAFRNAFDAFYIKVTQFNTFVDGRWNSHYQGLAGKPRAPYHFMGKRGSWASQVNFFLNQANAVPWEWTPVLDVEFDANQQAGEPNSDDINQWKAEYRRQSGKKALTVYIGRNTLLNYAPPLQWVDPDIKIIVAQYWTNDYANAFNNLGYTNPSIVGVQYWNAGTAPGLTGAVDLNNLIYLPTEPTITQPTGADDMPLDSHWTIDMQRGRASATFESGAPSIVIKDLWVGAKSFWGDIPGVKVTFQKDDGSPVAPTEGAPTTLDIKGNVRVWWKTAVGTSAVTFEWDPTKVSAGTQFSPYLIAR